MLILDTHIPHVSNPASVIPGARQREPGMTQKKRHGRACPGHPHLPCCDAVKTWMPGTSPGITTLATSADTIGCTSSLYFDAVFLLAMLTTCTRRFTSASGLAWSLSLLLP